MRKINQGKVSVLISTKDRPILLRVCLRSIAKQSHLPDEVIVLDASRVPQKSITTEFTQLPIRYFYSPSSNCPQGRNQAIRMARNNLLLIIDDDCRAERRWIEKMLNLYKKHQNATVISGKLVHTPQKSMFAFIIENVRSYRKKTAYEQNKISYMTIENCLLVKEKIIRHRFKIDERIPRGEEIDFAFQIQSKGELVVLSNDAKVYHQERNNLWRFLKQRFINAGNTPSLKLKWPRKMLYMYGSRRMLYVEPLFKGLKHFLQKGDIWNLIRFITVVFLSVFSYEMGYLYYSLKYRNGLPKRKK